MKNVYGIKTININGMDVYTYKIGVKITNFNLQKVQMYGLPYYQGRNKIWICLTSMNSVEFSNSTQLLGKVLKEIALNNVEEKYYWAR